MLGINFRRAVCVMLLATAHQALMSGSTVAWADTAASDEAGTSSKAATVTPTPGEPNASRADDPPVPADSDAAAADGSLKSPAPSGPPSQDGLIRDERPAALETISEALAEEDPALIAIREQIAAQEFDESIVWLDQQINLIERVSHRYAQELIEPLTLLGDAHAGKGEYETALGHYQRATHLSRVNHGLNAAEQVPIVYREANAFKAMQDFEEANDREEYAYHVLTRAHGSYDAKILPGVYHLADWYAKTNNVFSARAMYEHALNVLTATGQAQSEIAVPAYRGIATSYRLERFPPYYVSGNTDNSAMRSQFEPEYADTVSVNNFPAAERALQQIIAIYRENPEQHSLQAQIESILDLADWYLLWDKYSRAHPLYAHAYGMVGEIEGVDVAEVFAVPKLLHFPAPQRPKLPPPHLRGEQQQGVVEVAFAVSVNGHVRSMTTVTSVPEGMMDFRVRKSLRMARYRPALVDGVPVTHDEHRYQYNFAYFPKIATEEARDAE